MNVWLLIIAIYLLISFFAIGVCGSLGVSDDSIQLVFLWPVILPVAIAFAPFFIIYLIGVKIGDIIQNKF